jgi:CRP-like cAMP-binding protein
LSPKACADLLTLGADRAFQNEILMREGDTEAHVVILRRGFAKVTGSADGSEALLGVRGPGDIVGELAALTGRQRTATVTACGPVLGRVVLRDAFRQFLRRFPDASEQVTASVGDRLTFANRRRVEFGTLPAVVRLAHVLTELVAEPTGETALAVPIVHAELASLIGASEDTVQRALAVLRKEGLVRTAYRRIIVLDLVRLAGYP